MSLAPFGFAGGLQATNEAECRSSKVMVIVATRAVEGGALSWLGWDYENAGNLTAG
jgi:hypothetical protein